MALSKEDKTEIAEIIRTIMGSRECACGISPETQNEMGHFFGRVKDLGDGNLNIGIERFSRAVALMSKVRGVGEKVGGAVFVWLAIVILGGIGTAMFIGVKSIVQGWKG